MSSLLRRIQRKAQRKRAGYEPNPQYTEVHETGYLTLHPTKGWKRLSYARVAARDAVLAIRNRVLPERRKRPAKVWRRPAPCPPSVETRQQRRHAARKAAQ